MDESLTVLFRSFIAFFTLLIYARILGKQQITQLNFFEYVTGISIGSIAASMSVDLTSRALPHFAGLTMWFVLTFALQYISVKVRWLAKLIGGEPTVVIQNGKILDRNMKILRYRLDELLEQLRVQKVFDIGEVEYALLETNGNLSVLLKSQHQPVTPGDLGIATEYEGLAVELIMDGRIQDQNLAQVNLTREWLVGELKKRGINSPKDVFYAVLNTRGDLFVDIYQDKLQSVSDVSDYPGVN